MTSPLEGGDTFPLPAIKTHPIFEQTINPLRKDQPITPANPAPTILNEQHHTHLTAHNNPSDRQLTISDYLYTYSIHVTSLLKQEDGNNICALTHFTNLTQSILASENTEILPYYVTPDHSPIRQASQIQNDPTFLSSYITDTNLTDRNRKLNYIIRVGSNYSYFRLVSYKHDWLIGQSTQLKKTTLHTTKTINIGWLTPLNLSLANHKHLHEELKRRFQTSYPFQLSNTRLTHPTDKNKTTNATTIRCPQAVAKLLKAQIIENFHDNAYRHDTDITHHSIYIPMYITKTLTKTEITTLYQKTTIIIRT